jgi:hypothetical protein
MAGRRRLNSIHDLRRYIANLINRAEAGEIEPAMVSKLGYLANSLAKLIEISDLEKRLERVEAQLEQRKQSR